MKEEKLPTHEKCPYCQNERRLPPYVYAHWDDRLTTTCDVCQKQYNFYRGKTTKIRK